MKVVCPLETNKRELFGGICLEKSIKSLTDLSLNPKKKICSCGQVLNFLHEPQKLANIIQKKIATSARDVIVNGPFEQRIIIIQILNESSIIISVNGDLRSNAFVIAKRDLLKIDNCESAISPAYIPDSLIERLKSPLVKLVALYHPENFPLPRFALGISDIARSIREEYIGQVTLSDMQLNKNVYDISNEIKDELPDIIGISVTFGQQDVLEKLLSLIASKSDYSPLIVIGGSLAALNSKHLVETYHNVIVGLGDGESTMPDIIRCWYKEKGFSEANNVMILSENGTPIKTPKNTLPSITAGIPELDLLPYTLQQRGVMQLEATRGCSYACSFCPRSHKGIWSAQSIDLFEKILPEISDIYSNYPDIAKKIFLVDEEFVGYRVEDETSTRVLSVCNTLKKYGFSFETSARVDQVYRRNRDGEWHIERLKLWNYLVDNGLDRVLFGVESGVDSILRRFNKKSMKYQNEYAIRILSSSNIPVRLTYITFDPLMTMDELLESFHFQGKRGLLLKSLKHLTEKEIFNGIHDEDFVKEHSRNQPLYHEISYMLVSMECLIGSSYLKQVEDAGLAREYIYSMGKRNAEYLDKKIGLMSYNSQLWVDRNFSLDYMIKSLEKISPKDKRPVIRELRHVVKDFSYSLLSQFLATANNNLNLISYDIVNDTTHMKSLAKGFDHSMNNKEKNQRIFEEIMDFNFFSMGEAFQKKYQKIKQCLNDKDVEKMDVIVDEWRNKSEWRLINAA